MLLFGSARNLPLISLRVQDRHLNKQRYLVERKTMSSKNGEAMVTRPTSQNISNLRETLWEEVEQKYQNAHSLRGGRKNFLEKKANPRRFAVSVKGTKRRGRTRKDCSSSFSELKWHTQSRRRATKCKCTKRREHKRAEAPNRRASNTRATQSMLCTTTTRWLCRRRQTRLRARSLRCHAHVSLFCSFVELTLKSGKKALSQSTAKARAFLSPQVKDGSASYRRRTQDQPKGSQWHELPDYTAASEYYSGAPTIAGLQSNTHTPPPPAMTGGFYFPAAAPQH